MPVTNKVLLFFLCAGVFAQCAIAQRATNDTRVSSSFEERVDVGGRRLHILCTGRNVEGSLRWSSLNGHKTLSAPFSFNFQLFFKLHRTQIAQT